MILGFFKEMVDKYTSWRSYSRRPFKSLDELRQRCTGTRYKSAPYETQLRNQEWKKRNISKFKTEEEYFAWKNEKYFRKSEYSHLEEKLEKRIRDFGENLSNYVSSCEINLFESCSTDLSEEKALFDSR